jgi:5-formyltetrahydrofolate cyclo-ligase
MSAETISSKDELRRATLARRDALEAADRAAWSNAICARAADVIREHGPAVVSAYWPIRSEVDIRPLIGLARELGAEIALPAITDGRLVFRGWQESDPFVAAGFGLSEPGPGQRELAPDLMLVPMAAFDRAGNRLGYGKGYYDGAIAALRAAGSRPRLLGIAFSSQEVPSIPAEAHDVRLDWIATDRELLAFGR